MTFSIYDFKVNGLFEGGARPNKFEVALTFPTVGIANPLAASESRFLVQAASLPASIMGVIQVPYQGRSIKVSGDREYPNWQITVMNREDFDLKNAFEQWHQGINGTVSNVMDPAYVDINGGYKVDFTATQMTKDNAIAKIYTFVGGFPTDVGPIQLQWDQNNQIETFTVDFAYDLWTSPDTTDF